jgi:hypothetical protein
MRAENLKTLEIILERLVVWLSPTVIGKKYFFLIWVMII